MRHYAGLLAITAATALIGPAFGALDYSSIGSSYNQTFDTLATMGSAIAWTNDSTLPGWSLFRVTSNTAMNTNLTPIAISSYEAGDGSLTNARFWSFGTGTSTDRALGSVGGTPFGETDPTKRSAVDFNRVAGWIAASFTNNTGLTLNQFTASFNGEQWLDGGNNGAFPPQQMVFEYGFGATFASVTSWTAPGGNFNWAQPQDGLLATNVDGNAAGLVAGRGGTVVDLSWTNGAMLWLRWIELNDVGADAGLAIDNFSFSATIAAVPEPAAALLGGVVSSVIAIVTLLRSLARRFAL